MDLVCRSQQVVQIFIHGLHLQDYIQIVHILYLILGKIRLLFMQLRLLLQHIQLPELLLQQVALILQGRLLIILLLYL